MLASYEALQLVRNTPDSTTLKPSTDIVLAAGIQFVASVLLWVPSAILLLDDAAMYRQYSAAAASPHAVISLPMRSHAYYAATVGAPICLSLLGVVTGRGLLRMRNWARRVTLYMATVPVCICGVLLKLDKGGPLDFLPVFVWPVFVILLPVSIWWWVLFTRKGVRSQFR